MMTKTEAWIILLKMIAKGILNIFGIKGAMIADLGLQLSKRQTWIILMWKVFYISAFLWAFFFQILITFGHRITTLNSFIATSQVIIFVLFFLIGNLKLKYKIINQLRLSSDLTIAVLQIIFFAYNNVLDALILVSPAWFVIYFYHKRVFISSNNMVNSET